MHLAATFHERKLARKIISVNKSGNKRRGEMDHACDDGKTKQQTRVVSEETLFPVLSSLFSEKWNDYACT